MYAINLSPIHKNRIEQLAQQLGCDEDSFVQELIDRGLEDIEDLIAANEISIRIKEGKEKTFSSEFVRKELGLED